MQKRSSPSSTTKKSRTVVKPRARRPIRRKKKRRNWWALWFLKKCPSWLLWTCGIIATVVYVYFFYAYFVGPFSFRWKALYGDAKYPDGYSIQGIDISHYQGTIDWEKVRNAAIDGSSVSFVIIKATEGVSMMDEYFNDNFYKAREWGLIRGAYHFFVPSLSAKEQAEFYLRQVHLEPGDLPPVLDIEHVGPLTPEELKKAALTWLTTVEAHYRVKPIIYSGYKFKQRYLNDAEFNAYPYWIAHYYVDTLQYKGPWKFWQYSDCARIDGIKGMVDVNIYNGSMYDLQKFTIAGEESEDDVY